MKVPFLLGRLIVGGFFLYNGMHHFKQRQNDGQVRERKERFGPRAGGYRHRRRACARRRQRSFRVKPKIGTAIIAGFLAAVTPIMHNFWRTGDSEQRMNEMVICSKNTALLGSALALMAVEEPWPVSVPVGQPGKLEQARRALRQLAG